MNNLKSMLRLQFAEAYQQIAEGGPIYLGRWGLPEKQLQIASFNSNFFSKAAFVASCYYMY